MGLRPSLVSKVLAVGFAALFTTVGARMVAGGVGSCCNGPHAEGAGYGRVATAVLGIFYVL